MSRFAIVLLVLAVSIAQAQAKEKETDYAEMGFGTLTCGQFAAHYRQEPSLENNYFEWAQGFMSGMNFMRVGAGWVMKNLASMPTEQQQRVIRRYCNDHPLSEYLDAVMDLYFSLKNSDYRSKHMPVTADPIPNQ